MSIRRDIIEACPLGVEAHVDSPLGDDALSFAVEMLFRGTAKYSSIDGFKEFYVLNETDNELSFVGRAYFLEPWETVPIETYLRKQKDGISYRLFRAPKESLSGLTDKKLWQALYLYATEGYELPWKWGKPDNGVLN